MYEPGKESLQHAEEINPYVSRLASKLIATAADAQVKFDSTGWQLITEVLSFAASAEQRMAEQSERISHLEQISITDELTGILNRRGLKQQLLRTLASCARHEETGVLGFIDLDDFKAVNDTYGHGAGDAALRLVSSILKKATRSTDIISRLAGDEFAVILTRCSADQGQKRLEDLQNKLNTSVLSYAGNRIPLKCSIGIHAFDGRSEPDSILSGADFSMYQNKESRKTAA